MPDETARKDQFGSKPRGKQRGSNINVHGSDRNMRGVAFTPSEVFVLSVINPLSAVFIGWGVNVYCSWAEMPSGAAHKAMVGWSSAALLMGGSAAQLISWMIVAWVYWQTRESPGALWRRLRIRRWMSAMMFDPPTPGIQGSPPAPKA